MSILTVSLYCCSQPVLLLCRTAEFCSPGTYLWSYRKFWRVLQSLVELWEERLFPAELLGKFSSPLPTSFLKMEAREKCSVFTLCMVRNKKWYLLEFLYCQLDHQTNVGCSGSIDSDPCELSLEIAQWVWGWWHLWLFGLVQNTDWSDRHVFKTRVTWRMFSLAIGRRHFCCKMKSTNQWQMPNRHWLVPMKLLRWWLLQH